MTDTIKGLPKWKCHKEVWAVKILNIRPGTIEGDRPGATIEAEEGSFSVGEEYIAKHDPEEGGYYVRYADGYESFSPAKAFEEGYTRI